MPLYRYFCANEEEYVTIRSPVDKRDDPKPCPHCNYMTDVRDEDAFMQEILEQNGHVFEPYFDENLADDENPHGIWVDDRSTKREQKKKIGLREKGSYVE